MDYQFCVIASGAELAGAAVIAYIATLRSFELASFKYNAFGIRSGADGWSCCVIIDMLCLVTSTCRLDCLTESCVEMVYRENASRTC